MAENDEALEQEQGNAEDSRPDWLPDNFSTPEALAQSYGEAQRKISQQGQELNELRSEFEQITELVQQQNQQPQYNQQQEHPLVLAAQQALDVGDAAAFLAINAQLSQEIAQQTMTQQQAQAQESAAPDETLALIANAAENRVRERYPDYDAIRGKVEEKLTQYPGLVSDRTLNGVQAGIEAAYTLVKGEDRMRNDQDSAAQAAAAEADRQQKLAATGLTGGGARQAPPDEAQAHMQSLINMRSGTFSELLNDARK